MKVKDSLLPAFLLPHFAQTTHPGKPWSTSRPQHPSVCRDSDAPPPPWREGRERGRDSVEMRRDTGADWRSLPIHKFSAKEVQWRSRFKSSLNLDSVQIGFEKKGLVSNLGSKT